MKFCDLLERFVPQEKFGYDLCDGYFRVTFLLFLPALMAMIKLKKN